MPTTVRDTIATRIADLGLTAYTAAGLTAGRVSGEQIARYLSGDRDLRTATLDPLLAALGLALRPAGKINPKKSVPVH